MKFSIRDFFSKCGQIRKKLRIWSYLLKKSLMENFIFCAVFTLISWCGNFVEKQSFRMISDSPKIMSKLCLSTKFPHQDIRWNYGIFRSEGLYVQRIFSQYSLSITHILPQKNSGLWSLDIDLKWVERRVSSRISRPEMFLRKGIWKYAANLQENNHAEVWFQWSF